MQIASCAFALASLALTSCLKSKPSDCQHTVVVPVLSTSGPKTVAVYQPAIYVLSYELQSSCGKLNSITEGGNVSMPDTHEVYVAVEYTDCNCPQIIIPSQAAYTFVPTKAGTYYFKFRNANSFLTDTLVVK